MSENQVLFFIAYTFTHRKDRYPLGKLKLFSVFRVRVCIGGKMWLCVNVGFAVIYIFSNEMCSTFMVIQYIFVHVVVLQRRRAHFNVGRSGFLFTLILIVFV